jgi:peptidoglycan/xylan/chitin deacetylase (PgdA/CDA1 family)
VIARPSLALAALLLASGLAADAAETAPPGTASEAATTAPKPWDPAEKAIRKRVPEARVAVPDVSRLPAATPLPPALAGSIRRVELPAGDRRVALTFDLCETANEVAGYDGAIVDTLRRRGVHATLFVGGHWAATHPERFRELARDPLFEIANHTWTHANLRTVDDERLVDEVLAPEATFAAVAGLPRSKLMRYPFGACNDRAMAAVNGAGMAAIQWDVSTGDPSPGTGAAAILANTLPTVRPGSIVLAHANGRGWHTAEALPKLIDALEAKGLRFATVGELLASGRPVVTPTCYDNRPGDTDRYDHLPFHPPAKPAAAAPKAPTTAPNPAPIRGATP